MADRLYSAQIDYPFQSHSDQDYIDGILDCLLYMSSTDTFVTPPAVPAGVDRVGGWLYSREKVGSDYRYIFYAAAPADPNVYDTLDVYEEQPLRYVVRTFLVPTAPTDTIVIVRAQEDGRSVLTVNNGQLAGADPLYVLNDNLLEPATVVPCTRRVTAVNLYNEYRIADPADRVDVPPDFFVGQAEPGELLEFNDGYNCAVAYNETTKTLRFTGGIGLGLGLADEVPWNDTDENFEEGVRSVNGVNVLGTVPIEVGSGVVLDSTIVGQLKIIVRNQGDGGCPPG